MRRDFTGTACTPFAPPSAVGKKTKDNPHIVVRKERKGRKGREESAE